MLIVSFGYSTPLRDGVVRRVASSRLSGSRIKATERRKKSVAVRVFASIIAATAASYFRLRARRFVCCAYYLRTVSHTSSHSEWCIYLLTYYYVYIRRHSFLFTSPKHPLYNKSSLGFFGWEEDCGEKALYWDNPHSRLLVKNIDRTLTILS